MTPEDEPRILDLSRLIADEKDLQKLIILASELERLLTSKLERATLSPPTANEKTAE